MADPFPTHDLPDDFDGPQRISALAVSSLVFGLLCCVPVVGLFAAILGGASLIRIRDSEGRLGGKTLAIIGIVLGVIGTLGWLMIGIGMRQVYNSYQPGIAQPAASAMRAADAGDWTTFRTLLDPAASARLSDDDIKAFADLYHARLGDYQRPNLKAIASVLFAPQPAGIPAHASIMPVPSDFQKTAGLVILISDSPSVMQDVISKGASAQGTVGNILVIGGGKDFWLIDPMKYQSPPTSSPPRTSPPPGSTGPDSSAGTTG